MSAAQGTAPVPTSRSRLAGAGKMVLDGVLVARIRDGRLRNVGWPAGWSAVVGVGIAGFVVAAGLVLTAPLLRQGDLEPVTDQLLVPRGPMWLVALLVVTVAALLHTAAIHAVWWAKVVTLVLMSVLMGLWAVSASTGGGGLLVVPGIACILTMIIFSLARMRRTARWWELAVFMVLFSVPIGLATWAAVRLQYPLGFDLVPAVLLQTLSALALLALPAAVASGTAVAELTVAATVWVAAAAGRLTRRPVLLIMLGVALGIRVVQTGFDVVRLAALVASFQSWLPVAGCIIMLVVVSGWLLRRSARAGGRLNGAGAVPGPSRTEITDLPEQLSRLSLPIGAALLGILLPFTLIMYVVQIVLVSRGEGSLTGAASWLSGDALVGVVRLVLGVLLIMLAVRTAGRGNTAPALLAAHIGVLVLASPVGVFTHASFSLRPDPDLLNLVVTAVSVVVLVVSALTRRLTAQRAVVLGALVVLGSVFSGRDTLLAPLTAIFGPGTALIVIGLVWALLTGCALANVDGSRFPASSRALLIIGNILLAAVILAFYSLAGQPSQGGLDMASSLGDAILGTGLLTTTVTLLLVSLRSGHPLT